MLHACASRSATLPTQAPLRRSAAVLALAVTVGLAACGDTAAPGPSPEAVPGTAVVFDLAADLRSPDHFYDLPIPFDLRLDENGYPDHRGFPLVTGNLVVPPLLGIADREPGWSTVAATYLRFSGPLAPRSPQQVISPEDPSAPVLILDVDRNSPHRGEAVALVLGTPRPDAYAPGFLLAVAPAPGVVLAPSTGYAVVVLRSLGDEAGKPLGVSEDFAELRAGRTPTSARGAAAAALLAPLWPVLERRGVALADVAAATVFTTGDAVGRLAAVLDGLAARDRVEIADLHLDPDDGSAHPRFCELHGTVDLPQYQSGVPPFDRDGHFVRGSDGLPLVQRRETAPVVIDLPRTRMPDGGYPLVVYFHGSSGLATQVVDRGRTETPGGTPRRGEGPAHVLAEYGLATFASALPLNPERLPGAAHRGYLNLANLAAYPETFAQTVIEQRQLLDALQSLTIPADVVRACTGASLPAGAAGFAVATDEVGVMGQSLGAQITTMVGALERRAVGAMPSGSGGHWSRVTLEAQLVDGLDVRRTIGPLIGTFPEIDYLHPALQLLQAAWEPAEPLVFAARIAKRPLPGHPARAIYQPAAIDDLGFPTPIYDAMALAYGTQRAGPALDPGLARSLALEGRESEAIYPVSLNLRSDDGAPYTGVVAQVRSDGILDGHHVFAQLDDVKAQYGCFFTTLLSSRTAVVPSPELRPGDPCPR